MKILYITSHLDDAGSFYVLKGLFKALRERGDDVTYVNLKETRDEARGAPTRSLQRPVASGASGAKRQGIVRRLKGAFYARFPAVKRIVFDNLLTLPYHLRAIRDTQPDVLIGRNASGGLTCLLAWWKGIPYVTHMDGLQEAESVYGLKSTLDYRFFLKLGRAIFKRFGPRVAVVTEAVKSALVADGLDGTKITVLDNGVDTVLFDPETEPHPDARQPADKIVVGFVGFFAPWHQIDDFLGVIPSIVRKNPSVVFLFLGRSQGATQLLEGESRANVVVIDAVPQDEVPSVIACFDIGVLPFTAYSCSPLKLYEYMAMGKATVAPRYASIEAFIEHSKDGYLFEPDDMDALEDAILGLAGDEEERRRMGRAARNKMVEHFTWRQTAERFRSACEASITELDATGRKSSPRAPSNAQEATDSSRR